MVRHHDDVHRLLLGGRPALLDHGRHADVLGREDARDPGQYARLVEDEEPEVVRHHDLVHRDRSRSVVSNEHLPGPGLRAMQLAAREFHDVRHHCACRRHPPRAPTVEHLCAHRVAHDLDRVELMLDVREQTAGWDHHGVHARLDAVFKPFGDGQELDRVPQFPGVLDVLIPDVPDALTEDIAGPERCAERDPRQDGQLLGRIRTVHVHARIRLRISPFLGLPQGTFERAALVGHLRQDVVRGPVQDAVQRFDPVRDESVPQGSDDRDAGAHARLKQQIHAMLVRGPEQLLSMFREQRLVRGDHALPVPQCAQNKRPGGLDAADHLDDDVHLRIDDDPLCVRSQHLLRKSHIPGFRHISHRDLPKGQIEITFSEGRGRPQEQFGDPAADCPTSQQADADRVHTLSLRS